MGGGRRARWGVLEVLARRLCDDAEKELANFSRADTRMHARLREALGSTGKAWRRCAYLMERRLNERLEVKAAAGEVWRWCACR